MVKHKRVPLLEELDVIGDGIYCIFPFSGYDLSNKGLFKIGISAGGSFYHRLEGQYHTYFPMGWYPVAFIEFRSGYPIPENKQDITKSTYYKEIEKYIFENIRGRKIISNARTVQGGKTEWIYTHENEVHKIFKKSTKIYGGKLHQFQLTKKIFAQELKNKKIIFEAKINFV